MFFIAFKYTFLRKQIRDSLLVQAGRHFFHSFVSSNLDIMRTLAEIVVFGIENRVEC